MRKKSVNPFSVLLGVVGIAFTLTASSYCLFVLRGVRPETARGAPHAFELAMDRWGTTALVVELALLALATFGSIAVDEIGHREVRELLRAERDRTLREGTARGSDGTPDESTGERPTAGGPPS